MTINKQAKYLIVFVIIFNMACVWAAQAQTSGTNYVRTRYPRIPVKDTALMDTIPVQRQAVNVSYSDALGRTWQSIQMGGSPLLKDIVVPLLYNNMGRQVQSFLPYVDESTSSTNTGTFRSGASTNAVSFYSPTSPGAPKIPTDSIPYAQAVYETSPLGRVTEQGQPGAVFQPGTGHTTRVSYGVNALTDSINYYTNYTSAYYEHYGLPFPTKNAYAANRLTKTIITDANGLRTAVWKDLQGRVVTKTQLDAPPVSINEVNLPTDFYSTDYVYNDLNQLRVIITPGCKQQLYTQPDLSDPPSYVTQAYIFHYDSIGRVVEKLVPGKGYTYIVYNHANQPVLTQDSNMRAKNQWLYSKYDAEGRIIQAGLYTNTTVTSRKALQYLCDNSFPVLWETWQPGTGYTNNAFPQQSMTPAASALTLYMQLYYDDYSFTEAASKSFQTNVYNTVPTGRTMGKLTGTSTYVLGTANQRLAAVYYYDNQDRLIQEQKDNHLGYVDVTNNQYNFVGEQTGSQRVNTAISGNPVTVQDRYVYDHLGRLLDTYESFQGAAEIDISHNAWNEIGLKVSEGLHSTQLAPANITENTTLTTSKADIATNSITLSTGFSFTPTNGSTYSASIGSGGNSPFAQTQEFRYDINGRIIGINNSSLTYDSGVTQSDPNALFGETISYEKPVIIGTTPQYNGNISAITWRNKIEQSGQSGLTTGTQGYAFSYDNANRLLSGTYYKPNSSGTLTTNSNNALNEFVTGYDVMGNITSMIRWDNAGHALNSLTNTYPSGQNQLSGVQDSGSQNATGTFSYDGNGNMTADTHKGITITYNCLDLPDTVKQGSSKLVFTYDAAGNKLYKQLITSGSVVSQRHYIGDLDVTASSSIAYDGKVESVAMDEGRVINTGTNTWQYEYYMQDHLFTNRVTFRPNADGSITLADVQNYYPFGANMGDGTMNYNLSPQNLYLYEGKEMQPELNLNTYDFGARHYDPILARWTAVDPLATQYDNMSPYDYVANNPLNFVDPDGMQYTTLTNGLKQWGASQELGVVTIKGVKGVAGGAGGAFGIGLQALGVAASLKAGWSVFTVGAKQTINLNGSLNTVQGNTRVTPAQVANQGAGSDEAAISRTFLSGYMQTLPYSMSDKEGTIDCSRCTMQIAASAGYNIPRTAYDQAKWYQKNGFWSTSLSDAQPGDHMFWLRGVNLYHTGVISRISSLGKIYVVQANVNNYDIPSIHEFRVQPNGTINGFGQKFVGLGRYTP